MFTRGDHRNAGRIGRRHGGQCLAEYPLPCRIQCSHHPVAMVQRRGEHPASGHGSIACEYDPVSDMVVIVSQDGLWTYDPKTETAARPCSSISRTSDTPMIWCTSRRPENVLHGPRKPWARLGSHAQQNQLVQQHVRGSHRPCHRSSV